MGTFEQSGLNKQKTYNNTGITKEELPRYQLIACDVASKIASGVYPSGAKLYARSALASQYGVSSETARRRAERGRLDSIPFDRQNPPFLQIPMKRTGGFRRYSDDDSVESLKGSFSEC